MRGVGCWTFVARLCCAMAMLVACAPPTAAAQSATATLSGAIVDDTAATVPDATVTVMNLDTGLQRGTRTNADGAFVVPLLPPGRYRVVAARDGFRPAEVNALTLNVNDEIAIRLHLSVAPASEVVTVAAEPARISTSPAVSTIVDRQFVGNLPMNARSLQSLIALVPGMVRVPGSISGQFSANGQRENANYFTVDGVSANAAAGHTIQGSGGGLPTMSRLGTTNNLISIDAMQEFRIQTSSYAAEFGRTPGAQVSMVSRAGTNQVHGALFEYFRNDALDANNWFTNAAGLEKPPLRQNQFGGVLGGPLVRDRTFYFASYEAMRMRQPTPFVTVVPSLRLREIAAPAIKTLLDAFPLPTGPEIGTTGQAPFVAAIGNPGTLDAASVRLDQALGTSGRVFGRYNQAPSETEVAFGTTANRRWQTDRTRTVTIGVDGSLSPGLHNELRVNYSSNARVDNKRLHAVDGAVPYSLSDVLPYEDGYIYPCFFDTSFCNMINSEFGKLQRQLNVVDSLTYVTGTHVFKFGIDYRQLALRIYGQEYSLDPYFNTEEDIRNGVASRVSVGLSQPTFPVTHNYSAYAQDTWRATSRLTVSYGARWDANPAARDVEGNAPFVLRGLEDLGTARVVLLPEGERLYRTRWANIAPRIGATYRLFDRRPGWETVLRSGGGMFYDLGNGPTLTVYQNNPPFRASVTRYNVPYPLSAADAAPPPLMPASGTPTSLTAIDERLKSPYTFQWNVAVEQALGGTQTLTVTYVGASGRRLLESRLQQNALPTVPPITRWTLVTNGGTSDYKALQFQFQRRLSRGIQAMASYSWAHAMDTASDDFTTTYAKLRGDADFDVRHNLAGGLTWDLPSPSYRRVPLLGALLRDWGLDTTIRATSAYPLMPRGPQILQDDGTYVSLIPDVVPDQPIWITDATVAGGKRLNPAAFSLPTNGQHGNLARNSIRGFPFSQVDLSIRRRFPIGDRLRVTFRAEAFNVLNHPNFSNPRNNSLGTPLFGIATQMANAGLGGVYGAGTTSLYESGGPRSMQLSLRLEF